MADVKEHPLIVVYEGLVDFAGSLLLLNPVVIFLLIVIPVFLSVLITAGKSKNE